MRRPKRFATNTGLRLGESEPTKVRTKSLWICRAGSEARPQSDEAPNLRGKGGTDASSHKLNEVCIRAKGRELLSLTPEWPAATTFRLAAQAIPFLVGVD